MTWTQVARKDFEDAVRSKMIWGLTTVFVGFMAFVVAITVATTDMSEATSSAALAVTAQMGQLFVPLIAVIVGYMAIVGERRAGSLRVLLGYPHSRRDVVLGKLAGRSAVITTTLVLGSVASIVIVALFVPSPSFTDVVGMLASIVLFGVAFTGLAVGISASVRSRGKAMALTIGSLLVFWIIWDGIAGGVHVAATGALPGLEADAWYFLLKRLNPVGAFAALAESFVDGRVNTLFILGIEDIPADATAEQLALSNRVPGALPFYLRDWFAALTLAAWGVLPSVLGYVRFARTDL